MDPCSEFSALTIRIFIFRSRYVNLPMHTPSIFTNVKKKGSLLLLYISPLNFSHIFDIFLTKIMRVSEQIVGS